MSRCILAQMAMDGNPIPDTAAAPDAGAADRFKS